MNSLLESIDTKKVATVYEFSADPIVLQFYKFMPSKELVYAQDETGQLC